MLKKYIARALDLDEFDEYIFTEDVEKVVVKGQDELIIHFYDGQILTQKWKSTARTDCWTDDRREAWGEYQLGNKNAVGHKGRWLKDDKNK